MMTPPFAGASVCLKQLLAANNLEQAMLSLHCKKKTLAAVVARIIQYKYNKINILK